VQQFISLQIENKKYFFNWVEGDPDYIEQNDGYFLHYPSADPETAFDYDEVLKNVSNEKVICDQILDIINLMSDFRFDTKKLIKDTIYQKLFWGCNLPSVTKACRTKLTI
jgi:hypothetical protein